MLNENAVEGWVTPSIVTIIDVSLKRSVPQSKLTVDAFTVVNSSSANSFN